MQPDRRSSVRAGIFVIISLGMLMAGVIILGQRSQLLQKKYPLTTQFSNAQGLIPGADVRVAGVNAGTVRSIDVVIEPGEPTVVEVRLDVNVEYRDKIQQDSRASIRTLGPLGDKYIEIIPGESEQPLVLPYIQSDEPIDFYVLAEDFQETLQRADRIAGELAQSFEEMNQTAVIGDLSATAASIKAILGRVESGPGLAHTLVFDSDLPDTLDDFRATASALRVSAERLQTDEGLLGQLLNGDDGFAETMDNLKDVTASAKTILQEIEEGDGLAHALVYDRDLRSALAEIKTGAGRFNAVMADLQEGKGTLGLLLTDPAIWESMTRVLGGVEESRILKVLVRKAVSE